MNKTLLLILCLVSCSLTSCIDLEDTDFNPVYFLECDIDGEFFRAQTNADAWMTWTRSLADQYTVAGQVEQDDMQVSITSFESLGEGEIQTGTNVQSYLTNIAYFHDNKTYVATETGGGGSFRIELLTEEECEGTFEGKLVDIRDATNMVEITNGRFKVKVK